MKNVKHSLIVLLFFSFIFTLFFSPLLFSCKLFLSDEQLAAFYAPVELWSPLLYSGFPLQASIEWQNIYPLRFIFNILPNSINFNLFVLTVYILAGSFTYGYLYTLTHSKFAALTAGIVFSMNGFMMAHLGHTSMIHTALWLPLILWSVEKLRDKFSLFWFIIGSIAVALSFIAGHPQIFSAIILVTSFYVIFTAFITKKTIWHYGLSCLAVLFTGLGLAAIQFLPTWELVQLSVREKINFEEFIGYSLSLQEFPTLFFPYLFGHYTGSYGYYPYFGQSGGLTEARVYIGTSTILFIFAAFYLKTRRFLVIFWSLIFIFSLLLSLGKITPLAAIMYQIPIINQFRIPTRHFFELGFAASVLTGFGVYALQTSKVSKRDLLSVLGISVILIAATLLLITGHDEQLHILAATRGVNFPDLLHNYSVIVPLVIFFTATVLFSLYRYSQNYFILSSLKIFIIALLIVDLGSFGWISEWRSHFLSPELLKPTEHVIKYKQLLDNAHQRLQTLQGTFQQLFSPNLSYYHGIANGSGYSPFLLKRYNMLLNIQRPGFLYEAEAKFTNLIPENRSLDLLAVKYVLNLDKTAIIQLVKDLGYNEIIAEQYNKILNSLRTEKQKWQYIEKIGKVEIYENKQALPRAWLVSEVISASPEQILKTIYTSIMPDGRVYEPEHLAFVEVPFHFKIDNPDKKATAEIITLNNTHIEIETHSQTPAFLVLSDIFYPGWKAEIKGEKIPVLQTNYLLRGVPVPVGKQRVIFTYQPFSFYLGLLISLSVFIILTLISVYQAYSNYLKNK